MQRLWQKQRTVQGIRTTWVTSALWSAVSVNTELRGALGSVDWELGTAISIEMPAMTISGNPTISQVEKSFESWNLASAKSF